MLIKCEQTLKPHGGATMRQDFEMMRLAKLLEEEHRGIAVDRRQLRDLAVSLLPAYPDLRNTLSHLRDRVSAAA